MKRVAFVLRWIANRLDPVCPPGVIWSGPLSVTGTANAGQAWAYWFCPICRQWAQSPHACLKPS